MNFLARNINHFINVMLTLKLINPHTQQANRAKKILFKVIPSLKSMRPFNRATVY